MKLFVYKMLNSKFWLKKYFTQLKRTIKSLEYVLLRYTVSEKQLTHQKLTHQYLPF